MGRPCSCSRARRGPRLPGPDPAAPGGTAGPGSIPPWFTSVDSSDPRHQLPEDGSTTVSASSAGRLATSVVKAMASGSDISFRIGSRLLRPELRQHDRDLLPVGQPTDGGTPRRPVGGGRRGGGRRLGLGFRSGRTGRGGRHTGSALPPSTVSRSSAQLLSRWAASAGRCSTNWLTCGQDRVRTELQSRANPHRRSSPVGSRSSSTGTIDASGAIGPGRRRRPPGTADADAAPR